MKSQLDNHAVVVDDAAVVVAACVASTFEAVEDSSITAAAVTAGAELDSVDPFVEVCIAPSLVVAAAGAPAVVAAMASAVWEEATSVGLDTATLFLSADSIASATTAAVVDCTSETAGFSVEAAASLVFSASVLLSL